jgi:hypothetical protein
MRTYRLAIIGFGHMHVNHVAAVYAAHPQVEWVACADTRPDRPELRVAPYTREWNRDNLVAKLHLKCYDDYRGMLAEEAPDIVVGCSRLCRKADRCLSVRSAAHGPRLPGGRHDAHCELATHLVPGRAEGQGSDR